MKILLHLVLLMHLNMDQRPDTTRVYICTSPTAVAYHKSRNGCKGIQACSRKVIKVSKSDAIRKYKYRACKVCY
ncbi:hypothetical protein [Pedobacter steynii]|uniref:hypothetical protein n=1 Tax=Pedobacter steynii TaxID=430522 RepID=UPI001C2046D6|nr:hypothetical protein [Pedobacter steynii]